ncbi:MAG: hypothetical protein N2258_00135 [Brevinematales bacterium]|nr:hypothetical protein [Brevinematales bacterium]
MKRFVLFIFALIFVFSCSSNKVKRELSINDIFGDWVTVSGYDASEVNFTIDGPDLIFTSFLDERIFESGGFEIEGNNVKVTFSDGNETIFSNVVVNENMLSFFINGKKATFKAGEFNKRLRKLFDYLLEFNSKSGNVFSNPVATTLDWIGENREEAVLGYSMSLTIEKNGKITNGDFVYTLLEKEGFKTDSRNVTEILTGYVKEDIVCTVVETDDPEDTNLSYISMKFGILRK